MGIAARSCQCTGGSEPCAGGPKLLENRRTLGVLQERVRQPWRVPRLGPWSPENGGLRGTLMAAVEAATRRSIELGQVLILSRAAGRSAWGRQRVLRRSFLRAVGRGQRMMSIFRRVDDKNVPLYRVMWVEPTLIFAEPTIASARDNYEIRLERASPCGPSKTNATACFRSSSTWQAAWDPRRRMGVDLLGRELSRHMVRSDSNGIGPVIRFGIVFWMGTGLLTDLEDVRRAENAMSTLNGTNTNGAKTIRAVDLLQASTLEEHRKGFCAT